MVWNQMTFCGPDRETAPDTADSAKIRGAGRVLSRPPRPPPFPGPVRGVRDMGDILRDLFRRTAAHTGGMDVRAGPIWVANHFRAIADLVAIDQTRPQ